MATSLRAETASLVRLADRDLSRLWRLVANGAAADEALHDLLPAIVREYGAAGGAMAAEWYDQQREKVDAKGRFFADPIVPDDRGTHALVGAAVKQARDDTTLKTLILGGVQVASSTIGGIAGFFSASGSGSSSAGLGGA